MSLAVLAPWVQLRLRAARRLPEPAQLSPAAYPLLPAAYPLPPLALPLLALPLAPLLLALQLPASPLALKSLPARRGSLLHFLAEASPRSLVLQAVLSPPCALGLPLRALRRRRRARSGCCGAVSAWTRGGLLECVFSSA